MLVYLMAVGVKCLQCGRAPGDVHFLSQEYAGIHGGKFGCNSHHIKCLGIEHANILGDHPEGVVGSLQTGGISPYLVVTESVYCHLWLGIGSIIVV